MSYIIIKDNLIFCNQIKLIEEVETYHTTGLQVTFIDGATKFIYNCSLLDIRFKSGKVYETKNEG